MEKQLKQELARFREKTKKKDFANYTFQTWRNRHREECRCLDKKQQWEMYKFDKKQDIEQAQWEDLTVHGIRDSDTGNAEIVFSTDFLINDNLHFLTKQERQIIKLRMHGYGLQEIADNNLGLTLDMVKKSMQRIRKKCRENGFVWESEKKITAQANNDSSG